MTTIADTFHDPAGNGVGGVVVRATLVAASEVLAAGGAIIRETETITAADGTWSLTLTPISQLSVPAGAYYLITAEGHHWAVNVPDTGTHTIAAEQVAPAPLPPLGLTTATGVQLSTVAAKGDLLVGSGAGAIARLAVGTDTHVLTADSTQPDGVKWAVVTAGAAANGLPVGGTAGQALVKNTATDFDAAWHTLVKGDVGLGNVDNTSDVNKPISTATQSALDGKQPLDADLTTIAGLVATTDNVIQSVAGAWASRTPAQLKGTLALAVGDVAGAAPTASPTFTGTVVVPAETRTGRTKRTPTALSAAAATIAVDASLNDDFTVTLGAAGPYTLGAPSNPPTGSDTQRLLIAFTQDATGGRTVTLASGAGGYAFGTDITSITLTTTASKTDYLGVQWNPATSKWDVIAFVKGY